MRVYVKDLVLPVRLGVHKHERHAPQRVRFEVVVDVAPGPEGDAGYFSYDTILAAIRAAASGGHIELAEDLGEAIATTILGDRRAERVTVKVEKLEVIDGVLGVEQVFDRPP